MLPILGSFHITHTTTHPLQLPLHHPSQSCSSFPNKSNSIGQPFQQRSWTFTPLRYFSLGNLAQRWMKVIQPPQIFGLITSNPGEIYDILGGPIRKKPETVFSLETSPELRTKLLFQIEGPQGLGTVRSVTQWEKWRFSVVYVDVVLHKKGLPPRNEMTELGEPVVVFHNQIVRTKQEASELFKGLALQNNSNNSNTTKRLDIDKNNNNPNKRNTPTSPDPT